MSQNDWNIQTDYLEIKQSWKLQCAYERAGGQEQEVYWSEEKSSVVNAGESIRRRAHPGPEEPVYAKEMYNLYIKVSRNKIQIQKFEE